MGLLDSGLQKQYYQGQKFGDYQFTSLDDVITQFQIAYVGEDKIISKIKRVDVAFHAQRAMQELSFDTFKSVKSQQIDVPASLTMKLPHDYVNYTKISTVDSAGIKHPLYPTSSTSNPFQVRQDDDGEYSFPTDYEALVNADFSNPLSSGWGVASPSTNLSGNFHTSVNILNGKLQWGYVSKNGGGGNGWGQVGLVYQAIDTSELAYLDISADGVASDIGFTNPNTTTGTAIGTIRFGLSTSIPDLVNFNNIIDSEIVLPTTNASIDMFDITNHAGDSSYIEWTGNEASTKTVETLDVTNISTVYAIALSFVLFTNLPTSLAYAFALKPAGLNSTPPTGASISGNGNINSLDNLSVINNQSITTVQTKIGNETESSTWNNYKSGTPSENQDDYQDDTYWPAEGSRFGLDPQHAQANGSFFIDDRIGRIHFSSNISGKTVILDYISDSLGTNAEMQVHKFAEEAIYKWIAHAILATRANTQEYLVNRFKKERFAAIRTAKLRLSNIKLEEITQILRGKSKQIKH